LLFTSPLYIFAFLPLVVTGYFLLNRLGHPRAAKVWVVLSSLYFYAFWKAIYLPLILASMLVNYAIGGSLQRWGGNSEALAGKNKALLVTGIVLNLGLLGYYKYSDFFLANINLLFGTDIPMFRLLLPLAISFFTFQQIAYLVDCYRKEAKEYDLLNYCLFVSFFPQLIAGPIVHHKEMMPQFYNPENSRLNWDNIARGVFIFCMGLFKKTVIADTFAVWADEGYTDPTNPEFFTAWQTSLCYTMQLYYDFSGYSDMAIGAALLFNIKLPINFNSPYKSFDIQDFWRRWHMTLSRWLRDYLYIPLGGNRRGPRRVYVNLFATFLLGGLWHGAGWTFVLWGALHGSALCIHRVWKSYGMKMPKVLAWFITFQFVNAAWVFFRAENVTHAVAILKGMIGLNGIAAEPKFITAINTMDSVWEGATVARMAEQLPSVYPVVYLVLFLFVAVFMRNSIEIAGQRTKYGLQHALVVSVALIMAIVVRISTHPPPFLYFNF
jgi:alginate O-acetyltransferase complex protein AlgI